MTEANLSPEPFLAFESVKKSHPEIKNNYDIQNQTPNKVTQTTHDYVVAGFKYLAVNGPGDYIKYIGSSSLYWTNRGKFEEIHTEDIMETMKYLGLGEFISDIGPRLDEPHVFTMANKGRHVSYEKPMLVIPLTYILKARNRPLEAVATMARCASELTDCATGLATISSAQNLLDRALAAESHVLNSVLINNPDTPLSPQFWNSHYSFPNGLNDLPQSLLTNMMTLSRFKNSKKGKLGLN